MGNTIEVSTASELKDGSMKKVKFQKTEILLANVGGKFYAVNNKCPHLGGDLSKGKLDGNNIICPRHHSIFDVTDGHVIRWTDWSGLKLSLAKTFKQPRPLKTYKVKEEGEKILVYVD